MKSTQTQGRRWFRRHSAVQAPSRLDRDMVIPIRSVASTLADLTDCELQRLVDQLRDTVAAGTGPESDSVMIPGFALANEALRRVVGVEYFDVQLLGGMALTRGAIAEMQTGEGKTFVAALPAFMRALTGRGVHVATSNRYLAERDAQTLGPVFGLLGMTVGVLAESAAPDERRDAYSCDITYGPGCDFGFDYLRDQLTLRQTTESGARLGTRFRGLLDGGGSGHSRVTQRGLVSVVIDEADSVLIDDAGSPLIVSGSASTPAPDAQAWRIATGIATSFLERDEYRLDTLNASLQLTDAGVERVYGDADLSELQHLRRPWHQYVEQALRARHLFRRDVHYVIEDEEVRIVDQSTGRIHEERQWRDGLHQAIQAREDVPVLAESESLATITRQRFFRQYEHLCGMTGTARTSAAEFLEVYDCPVAVIPTNRPGQRREEPARYFSTADEKWEAVAAEVAGNLDSGRPLLVGTPSIEDSEQLADYLRAAGHPFRLLNGLQDDEEAAVVADAGTPGTVTIATNMAGRGTDIKLTAEARQLGGLRVIGTTRHVSRRIDRQLAGRAARQGEPGSCGFFVSAEDSLIRQYRPWLGREIARRCRRGPSTLRQLDDSVERLQRHVEQLHYQARRRLYYEDQRRDALMNQFAGRTA